VYDLSLEHGDSLATMAAVAAAAILLSAASYYRTFGTLKPLEWLSLLSLRIAAVVLIVLLLFRPVLSYYKELRQRPTLVFLLDRSASMSICDDGSGVTRFDRARERIETWWGELEEDFELRLVEFSDTARSLQAVEELPGLSAEGKSTSLARPLQLVAAELSGEQGDAAVMLSDGIDNVPLQPWKAATRTGVVVHTVGIGTTFRSDATYRDVRVSGIDCPQRLMAGNLARITASVEAVGYPPGHVVRVVLEEDGQAIAEMDLPPSEGRGPQPAGFEFRPAAPGRHTYTVRAPKDDQEKIGENNHRSAVALVVEPAIRVLLIEGTLREEYGALVGRFLAKDPDLEFCALVQTRKNVFLKRSNIADLELEAIPDDQQTYSKFDVFIIGDLDASYIRQGQQELLVKRIREGAGLVMLGGSHSLGPGGYAGTPLGEILPVALGNRQIGQINNTFLPVLTPEGVRHPIFANISDYFPTERGVPKIAGLPELSGCTRVEGARPAATVLATFPEQPQPVPVLAVTPVDRGRAAVFCGDTTRRWQQGPRALGQKSPFLQFWGQLVRWLAGRAEPLQPGPSVVARTDKACYEPGQPVLISAVVRDSHGEGAKDAKVEAKIRGPDGRPDSALLAPDPASRGNYRGTYRPEEVGKHEFFVEAALGQQALTTEKLEVLVGRPNREFDKLDFDGQTLEQIAAETGGLYVHVSTDEEFLEQLNRIHRKQGVQRKWPAYRWPLFLLLWVVFVGALTTEWTLRRRFQLR